MRSLAVAIALLAACRGDHAAPAQQAAPTAPATATAALVPHLPPSEPGAQELTRLDGEIALARDHHQLGAAISGLLSRAAIHGRLEDYQEALALSARWLDEATGSTVRDAWRARTRVLTRVHRFADARAALVHVQTGALDASEWQELAAAIDEASGQLDRSAPIRELVAREYPSPTNLTAYAASLALTGKLDDALAVIPRAAAAVRDNSPELLAFLLFQWGRLYELAGQPAAARDFYRAALARMATVDEAAHLAQGLIATGDAAAARAVVAEALRVDRHPELVALAATLSDDPTQRAALVSEARVAWERYVAALPEAFSDHAARFYLGAGADAARALALAKANLGNRDTREARALAVDAALAAHAPATACEIVAPLVDPPALRAQRFTAWRALAACGRPDDAARLAAALGIDRK